MALDITFVGIKPNGKCFDFSVVNNAKVDVINFILTSPLDSVNTLGQLSNLNAYVKVESAGGDYIDKISATSTYDSENEKLTVSFTLHKKTTSYKNIALQLQFEDLQNEVISQTEIVALSLKGTINADKEISDKYPEAIQELEKEVGSYSGRIEEVEEKVANAVLKTDIVDNLDSEDDKKVLSANQGKALNDKISSAISGVYKAQGTTTVATLNALIITEEMNGFVYDMLDSGTLTKGSVQVMEGDNVAIIWNEDKTDWKWDKLSGLVDLSNFYNKDETDILLNEKADKEDLNDYVDLASEQTISGKKVFTNGVYLSSNIKIYLDNYIKFSKGLQVGILFPTVNKQQDLGNGIGWYYRDLWLYRNIVSEDSNGNRFTIAINDIATKSHTTFDILTSNITANIPSGLEFSVNNSNIKNVNGEIKLTIKLTLTNNTSSQIAVGNANTFAFDIPEEISSKIKDMDEVLLNEQGRYGVGILAVNCYSDNGITTYYYSTKVLSIFRNQRKANSLMFQIRDMQSINANTTHHFIIQATFPIID